MHWSNTRNSLLYRTHSLTPGITVYFGPKQLSHSNNKKTYLKTWNVSFLDFLHSSRASSKKTDQSTVVTLMKIGSYYCFDYSAAVAVNFHFVDNCPVVGLHATSLWSVQVYVHENVSTHWHRDEKTCISLHAYKLTIKISFFWDIQETDRKRWHKIKWYNRKREREKNIQKNKEVWGKTPWPGSRSSHHAGGGTFQGAPCFQTASLPPTPPCALGSGHRGDTCQCRRDSCHGPHWQPECWMSSAWWCRGDAACPEWPHTMKS